MNSGDIGQGVEVAATASRRIVPVRLGAETEIGS